MIADSKFQIKNDYRLQIPNYRLRLRQSLLFNLESFFLESGIKRKLEAERVVEFHAKARLGGFEAFQFVLLPVVVKHDEKFSPRL